MSRSLNVAVVILALAGPLVAAPAPAGPTFTPLDLTPFVNQKLKDNFHGDPRPNNLAALPTGKQTFAKVKFTVADGVVQLGSARVKGPEKVEGIKVGRHLGKLHFLHSCGCGGYDPDGTALGKYVVHYEDESTEEVEIAYGKDVVDWWVLPGQKDATRSKVGWEGENEVTKEKPGTKLRLSLSTWDNPHPRKKVVNLDYVSAVKCQAAPFCVAITAEDG
jgi:hypothetical protein